MASSSSSAFPSASASTSGSWFLRQRDGTPIGVYVPKNIARREQLARLVRESGGVPQLSVFKCSIILFDPQDWEASTAIARSVVNVEPRVAVVLPHWLLDSVAQRRFIDTDIATYNPRNTRPHRRGSARGKKTSFGAPKRIRFSNDDIEDMVRVMGTSREARGGMLVAQEMERANPRHTAGSYQTYYRDHKPWLDSLVDAYRREHGINTPQPTRWTFKPRERPSLYANANGEADGEREEADGNRGEVDGKRGEAGGNRGEADEQRGEAGGKSGEADGNRGEADENRGEAGGQHGEADGEYGEADEERGTPSRQEEADGEDGEADENYGEVDGEREEADGNYGEVDGKRGEADGNRGTPNRRQPFTEEEDANMVAFLAESPLGRGGRKVFEELSKKFPEHPAGSWRARYRRKMGYYEELIKRHQIQHGGEGLLSPRDSSSRPPTTSATTPSAAAASPRGPDGPVANAADLYDDGEPTTVTEPTTTLRASQVTSPSTAVGKDNARPVSSFANAGEPRPSQAPSTALPAARRPPSPEFESESEDELDEDGVDFAAGQPDFASVAKETDEQEGARGNAEVLADSRPTVSRREMEAGRRREEEDGTEGAQPVRGITEGSPDSVVEVQMTAPRLFFPPSSDEGSEAAVGRSDGEDEERVDELDDDEEEDRGMDDLEYSLISLDEEDELDSDGSQDDNGGVGGKVGGLEAEAEEEGGLPPAGGPSSRPTRRQTFGGVGSVQNGASGSRESTPVRPPRAIRQSLPGGGGGVRSAADKGKEAVRFYDFDADAYVDPEAEADGSTALPREHHGLEREVEEVQKGRYNDLLRAQRTVLRQSAAAAEDDGGDRSATKRRKTTTNGEGLMSASPPSWKGKGRESSPDYGHARRGRLSGSVRLTPRSRDGGGGEDALRRRKQAYQARLLELARPFGFSTVEKIIPYVLAASHEPLWPGEDTLQATGRLIKEEVEELAGKHDLAVVEAADFIEQAGGDLVLAERAMKIAVRAKRRRSSGRPP